MMVILMHHKNSFNVCMYVCMYVYIMYTCIIISVARATPRCGRSGLHWFHRFKVSFNLFQIYCMHVHVHI